jgi:hypothetical protein
MKRISLLFIFLLMLTSSMVAQNIQVHYDLGHSLYQDLDTRPSVTTTVELFKPDRWGSTYFFTDIDYQRDGVAGAYGRFLVSLISLRISNGLLM